MTTLNLQVSADADDACELAGTTSLNITQAVDFTTDWGGTRFQNVTIPNAATINTAVWSGMPASSAADEPDLDFYAEDADTTSQFTAGINTDISGRARTTATVLWDSANLGADGATFFSPPDISALIAEVTVRAGWASGNSLVVVYNGGLVDTRDFGPVDYATSSTNACKLDIDYTAGTTTRRYSLTLTGVG